MKKRNLFLGIGLGLCLVGGGVGIGYSIKNANEIKIVEKAINEESEETKIEQLKAKLAEITNSQYASLIVSGGTTSLGIISFIITFFKYRKYKAINNVEIAEVVSKVSSEKLSEKYEELENKLVKELIKKFGNVEEALNIVQKVVILAQNKTTKGQAALMEYLSSKVKSSEVVSEDVKEAVEEVKESVDEEVEKEEEVKEEIQKEFTPVE